MASKEGHITTPPPTYFQPSLVDVEKKKRIRLRYALFAYAGVVSGALLVLAILGSIHIKYLKDHCDQDDVSKPAPNQGDWKNVTDMLVGKVAMTSETGTKTSQIYLNSASNKQMLQDPSGLETIIDYDKGITGHYDKANNLCYVIGGITNDVMDARSLNDYVQHENPEKMGNEVKGPDYTKGELVKDHSVLPSELQAKCEGKPTYWMSPNITDVANQEVGAAGCRWVQICISCVCYRCCSGRSCGTCRTCRYQVVYRCS